MGAGCSSPLRRIGGKRGKQRRDSSIVGSELNDNDQIETIASKLQQQHKKTSLTAATAAAATTTTATTTDKQQQKFAIDNEITIQSETNEDHPSSGSYYTTDVTKTNNTNPDISNEQQTPNNPNAKQQASNKPAINGAAGATVAARMMGLAGGYAPSDRHLLVSPALSPAPSLCQSPAPASSPAIGCPTLIDLNEMFRTLTFGLPAQQINDDSSGTSNNNQKTKQPTRYQSELHNAYSNHLVQNKQDLTKYISVVFLTADTIERMTTNTSDNTSASNTTTSSASTPSQDLDSLALRIESNLKAHCDEHNFNLKFLNLNYDHLSKYFYVNNLHDVALRILEQEYKENRHHLIVIILSGPQSLGAQISSQESSLASTTSDCNMSSGNLNYERKFLPTRVEAHHMNKLHASNEIDTQVKDLLKKWYNQSGNLFNLKPIYLIYPNILSESSSERDEAWRKWQSDLRLMLEAIRRACDSDQESFAGLQLQSLFDSYIKFLIKESDLLKRTLLIRNYSPNTASLQPGQTISSATQLNQNKSSNLNELARLLADPNKLSLKRQQEVELHKAINDWVGENFNKFMENILESHILYGKHVPPFIELNLFVELSCQRLIYERYLDNITDSYESKCNNFYTNQIAPILRNFTDCSTNLEPHIDVAEKSIRDSPTSPLSSSHLVIISGPKGCGKSTLFAQIIRLVAQDLMGKAQIIYRFCGSTLDSHSSYRVLRSICEQFCQLHGENITAASYIYSARNEVITALNKTIKEQQNLIFLDQVDSFKHPTDIDLDWLCEIEATPRVKIFIMLETDSKLYKKFLSNYTDATYISLDSPTLSDWAHMLTYAAKSRRFSSSGGLYDEIKSIESSQNLNNLTYTDINYIINMCRMRQLNNECTYPELTAKILVLCASDQTQSSIHQKIINHLHYIVTPYQLCALFIALGSSRYGLNEQDIIGIMNLISSKTSSTSEGNLRFSQTLFNYLKIQLEPWIVTVVHDESLKITLNRDFITESIDYYSSNTFTLNIVKDVRQILLEYFGRPYKTKAQPTKTSSSSEIRENVSRSETKWLATSSSETLNLILLINPSKAAEHIINKTQFFLQFFYRKSPEEFIEDYDRLKPVSGRKPSHYEELQCLVSYVRQSVFPLRYDGNQIFSQIYCRVTDHSKSTKLSKSKKFSEIITTAGYPPVRNLLPISEASVEAFIRVRIGQTPPKSTSIASSLSVTTDQPKPIAPKIPGTIGSSTTSKQKIFTIKDNHRHVIVIYPDKNSLAVWDIFEEKAVRTIINVDQPRDLRMIDQKRAVVLCNRELRVYDLDTGCLTTKLKGVMNQKMPFFEVYGENYVVALARNRMYVNMLNLNTGELETTFKVGEDRFLNSLLVSANGGICVCGDETQKPFPLLVWNLNERRLMYDLRLERHEFITRMSAISDDGHFVVSVCKQVGDPSDSLPHPNNGRSTSVAPGNKSSPNFIVIYDLNSGTLFKKWKPGLDTCGVAISLPPNQSGKVINTIVDNTILVWDLATGSKK